VKRWCGLGRWLDGGMRGGWKPELIVLAARIVAQQRKGVPPGSFHYLPEPLNQQHQEPVVNATPQAPARQLALVTIVSSSTNGASNVTGTDWKSRRDAGHRAYEKLKAYNLRLAEDREAQESGREADRFVPEPRSASDPETLMAGVIAILSRFPTEIAETTGAWPSATRHCVT
jgi:hypothetical protein